MSKALHARVSAVVAAVGVALGAFGAHGLQETFAEVGEKAAEWWETAVLYHLVHAVALFAIAAGGWFVKGAWWCLLAGILLFSGSLYIMAVTGTTKLVLATPAGGLAFIAGWVWMAVAIRGHER